MNEKLHLTFAHQTSIMQPGLPAEKINLAIFASGAGSNARAIIRHFELHPKISIRLIVCNKPGAGVLEVAKQAGIETLLITKDLFYNGDAYLPELQVKNIDFIALAGFLWKIPDPLIEAFPRRIVNIHPALLPAFGGKGMYGDAVHKAVLEAGKKESGITIHYVDGHYDNGDIIFQARCSVLPTDNAASLAEKIHQLEHLHYPRVIEKLLSSPQ
jgi:phosphoribosylglycinamide formyltransferase-1